MTIGEASEMPIALETVAGALSAQWSAVTVRPSGGNWVIVAKL